MQAHTENFRSRIVAVNLRWWRWWWAALSEDAFIHFYTHTSLSRINMARSALTPLTQSRIIYRHLKHWGNSLHLVVVSKLGTRVAFAVLKVFTIEYRVSGFFLSPVSDCIHKVEGRPSNSRTWKNRQEGEEEASQLRFRILKRVAVFSRSAGL